MAKFGEVLRELRNQAKLSQKQLGGLVHRDGSMISRFENGVTPDGTTIHQIRNVLALKGVSEDSLDVLIETAGYSSKGRPASHPIVEFVSQVFETLTPEQKTILKEDLQRIIEMDKGLFDAQETLADSEWAPAHDTLLSVQKQLQKLFQNYYMRLDVELGDCANGIGRYSEAVDHYEQAIGNARELHERGKEAAILVKLGDALRPRGGEYWEIALKRYDQAKSIFEDQKDPTRQAACLRKIAAVYIFQGRPDLALPCCEESIAIARREGNDQALYKALQHKAWAYDMLGKWDEASSLYEEAVEIMKRVEHDEWDGAKALLYLGDAYRVQRHFSQAEEAYKKALSIIESLERSGNKPELFKGMVLLGLGKVYLKQFGRELEAKDCLNDSLEIHTALGEDFRIAEVLSEQGNLLLKLGRLDEADRRLQQANERWQRLRNVFYYANTLLTISELCLEKQDFESLNRIAQEARAIDSGLINYSLANIELLVGRANVDQGNYREAVEAFYRASERALKFNDKTFQEINDGVWDEFERIGKKLERPIVNQLIEDYKNRVKAIEINDSRQEMLRKTLDLIEQKQNQFVALMPIP